MMEDEKIIELFFERSEQAIQELDTKYGRTCHNISFNILHNDLDAKTHLHTFAWSNGKSSGMESNSVKPRCV